MTPAAKLKSGNWGLKILALVLAILLYHMLKPHTDKQVPKENDRSFLQKH